MNQADVSKLVSKLKIKVPPRHRNLQNPKGPEGRLDKLRKTVTALIRHERIELNYNRADEARQYAERLISEAIRHGDCHKPTMEIADYWLLEKELVHKLFKVLVPRFEHSEVSFTKLYKAPKPYPGSTNERSVLELRGNPFPPLVQNMHTNRYMIHNILLDAAKYEYRQSKYAEIAKNIGDQGKSSTVNNRKLANEGNLNTEKKTTSGQINESENSTETKPKSENIDEKSK